MIQVVIFISVIAVILGVRLLLEMKKNDDLWLELIIEEHKRRVLEREFSQLRFNEMAFRTAMSQIKVSPDIKDAVHYAMVHAHPDNGGKQEDFIKFRKCYEQINV